MKDKSYWNVDDRNNVDMLRIISRETKSKFQLTIRVFSIAFVMSVIEKFTEFLNTPTMQYELRYKWGINAFVITLSMPHCLCWLLYFQNIITFLFEKLSWAVEILNWSDAVDFLTKPLGMPYSVITAQQACSTEMVKIIFQIYKWLRWVVGWERFKVLIAWWKEWIYGRHSFRSKFHNLMTLGVYIYWVCNEYLVINTGRYMDSFCGRCFA